MRYLRTYKLFEYKENEILLMFKHLWDDITDDDRNFITEIKFEKSFRSYSVTIKCSG